MVQWKTIAGLVLRTFTVLSLSVLLFSFTSPTLHLSHCSLPDSWQSQSGIRAVQTSATVDL